MRAAMGLDPIPWQRHVADVAGELRPDGMFRRNVIIVSVPRQCGKTTMVHGWIIMRCLAVPGTRAAFTAQTHKDARKRFMDTLSLVRTSPLGGVIRPRLSAGSEALTFPGGSEAALFAPLPDALHGSAMDLVGVDEVFAFDIHRGLELEQAILPTFTTRYRRPPGPQLWLFSTAGSDASSWLRKWVDLGRAASVDPSSPVGYFEWGAPEGSDPYDETLWPAVHPGIGHLTSMDVLRGAAASMERDEFARAYLNIWSRSSDRVIPAPDWAACLESASVCPARPVLGVDVAYDRSHGAIVAVGLRPDGLAHVEVVEHRPGTGWIAGRVQELARVHRARVAADPSGPAGSIVAELLAARGRVELVRGGDYAAACAGVFDAAVQHRLRHLGQEPLDDAVAAATRRPMGDAWAWGRKASGSDVSPLTAATVAHALAVAPGPRASIRVHSDTPAPVG